MLAPSLRDSVSSEEDKVTHQTPKASPTIGRRRGEDLVRLPVGLWDSLQTLRPPVEQRLRESCDTLRDPDPMLTTRRKMSIGEASRRNILR